MDRSVAVRLTLEIAQYKAGLSDASAATNRFASQAESSGKRVQKSEQSKGEAASSSAKTTAAAADTASKAQSTAAGAAEQASTTTVSSFDRAAAAVDKYGQEMQQVGTTLTVFGGAIAAALGLSAAAAISWESAWAGVQKTVDGSAQEMAALEEGLRGMAREMPATHQEIAAVAEAAGALGVATKDVEGFTRTMIMLGETTNLTSDEAATAIAQISNVMGTLEREGAEGVERFASTLVQLGNNGASTEREILMMAQRISSTASVIGMSESDVLAYANALASVGIRAEAGGTAISRVFMDIASSVSEGGEDLQAFAEVAGMSASQFATAFQEDPAAAVATFIQGLGDISAAGGDVFGVLSDLGMSDIRVSQALLTMAESGDLLTESLLMGEEAWNSNSALSDEYGKRLETVSSSLGIARNAIVDAAISLGSVFLPPIAAAAEGVASLAGWFADLPGPAQVAIGVIAGLAGAGTLLAGGLLLVVPRVVQTVSAFKALKAAASPGIARAISSIGTSAGRFATAAGRVGMGATAMVVAMHGLKAAADGIRGIDRTVPSVNEFANALQGAATSGDYYGAVLGHLADQGAINTRQFGDLGDAVRNAADPGAFDRFMSWANLDATGLEDVQSAFAGIGESLAAMPLEEAQQRFRDMWEEAGGTDEVGEQLLQLMPAYRDALAEAGTQAGQTGDQFDILAWALGDVSDETLTAGTAMDSTADEAAELAAEEERLAGLTQTATAEIADQVAELQTLLDIMMEIGGEFLSVQDAQARFGEELAGLTDAMTEFGTLSGNALDESGENWDFFSEKGRFASDTVNGLAEAGRTLVSSLDEAGASTEELEAAMQRTRNEVVNAAMGFGMGEEEANDLADAMGLIPENVAPNIDVDTDEGLARLAALQDEMNALPNGEVTINGDTLPAEDALNEIIETIDTTEADHIVINGDIVPVEEALTEVEDLIADGVSDIDIGINPDNAILESTQLVSDIEGNPPTIPLLAEDTSARETGRTFGTWVENLDPLAHIDAESDSAEAQTMWWQNWTNSTTGTTGIDAEDRGAESETRRITRMITGKAGTMGVLAEDRGATREGGRLARLIDNYGASVNVGAQARWAQINSVIATIQNRAGSAGAAVVIGGVMGRASGGEVWGSGTATSDSIPARLSNGEFVVRTAAADHYGRGLLHAINSLSLPKAAMFADGGQVGPTGWGRGGGYVPPPVQSGSTSVVNSYHLQINPGDLQGIRTLEELVANARRTSRQQAGVRG